jgi:hypothetical protein
VWRTRPEVFYRVIAERGASIIPSPEILGLSEDYKAIHTLDDAFRTSIYGLGVRNLSPPLTLTPLTNKHVQIAHMAWSDAALLFEDLARMGLTTASAIERAYKKDTKLLWRLVACFAKSDNYLSNLWGKLSQVISWCEHFRPYFKRSRVSTWGIFGFWFFWGFAYPPGL